MRRASALWPALSWSVVGVSESSQLQLISPSRPRGFKEQCDTSPRRMITLLGSSSLRPNIRIFALINLSSENPLMPSPALLQVPHNLSPAPEQDPDLSLPDTLLHPLAARSQPLTYQRPFLLLHLWTKQSLHLWISSAHPDLTTFLYNYHYTEANLPLDSCCQSCVSSVPVSHIALYLLTALIRFAWVRLAQREGGAVQVFDGDVAVKQWLKVA
ncbi:uncharacterized protein [Nothobranchius furzeri]|uniref:uncharacterized protein n=1 Tax=Nothobranchius furzeri TaxID=105023 RepID=UPI003904B02A